MLKFKKLASGDLTRSRTAIALFAGTLMLGGGITEASAKSRHHHHRHHHHAHHAGNSSWRDANASIGGGGSGRSFSGTASYYGNESGSNTPCAAAAQGGASGSAGRVAHAPARAFFFLGRVLDLSTGAARAVGLTGGGVG